MVTNMPQCAPLPAAQFLVYMQLAEDPEVDPHNKVNEERIE